MPLKTIPNYRIKFAKLKCSERVKRQTNNGLAIYFGRSEDVALFTSGDLERPWHPSVRLKEFDCFLCYSMRKMLFYTFLTFFSGILYTLANKTMFGTSAEMFFRQMWLPPWAIGSGGNHHIRRKNFYALLRKSTISWIFHYLHQ